VSNYTVNSLQQAAWLVYFNGLEIPVARVTATFGVWSVPKVTLTMVPHPIIQRLGREDRIQVVVFYLDHHWNPAMSEFRLLGEYEITGWSFSNTSNGRMMSFICESPLKIFDELHFFYIAALNDIATACGSTTSSDPSTSSVAKTLYPSSLFLEGLTATGTAKVSVEGSSFPKGVKGIQARRKQIEDTVEISAGSKFIKTPLEFVINIFRSLLLPVGDGIPMTAVSAPGKNFYARWLNMTQFHRKWVALPVLEDTGDDSCFPLLKATQDTQTLLALQEQIGQSVGNAGTAWQLLQQVYGYMYMEIATIPAPPSALINKKTRRILGQVTAKNLPDSGKTIATHFVKPQCVFALPPICNTVYASMSALYSGSENYRGQPTRIYLSENFMTSIVTNRASGSVGTVAQEAMSTGYPPEVKRRMWDLRGSPETSNKNMLLFPEEMYKGPVTKRLNAPPWMYMLSQQTNAGGDVAPKSKKKKTIDERRAEIEANQSAANVMPDGPLSNLFDKYTEYEFYRSRFASRGGQVSMAWNPYIVPGFPAMIFDSESQGFDVIAYVNDVTHTMDASGTMSTAVSTGFMRTVPEFLGILHTGLAVETSTYLPDISPVEIIPSIRDAFQVTATTDDLYRRLFYGGSGERENVVFDWKGMLDVMNSSGEVVDPVEEQWKINNYVKVKLKAPYAALNKSYDAAMRHIARPACTLREYVELRHNKSVEQAQREGLVSGVYRSFNSTSKAEDSTEKASGAVFWGRIYKLLQGPGVKPGVEVLNVGEGPDYACTSQGTLKFVGPETGMAQTREDWDSVLEAYRKIVRGADGYIAPQE